MTTVAAGEPARRLGDVLRAAGYGPDMLREATGASPPAAGRTAPSPRDTPALRRRLRDDAPAASVLRLFLLGVEVPFEPAQHALAPLPLADLVAAGILLVDEAGGVRSAIRIGWCDDVLIPCDWERASSSPAAGPDRVAAAGPDRVTGVAPASLTLADLTVRETGARALDVGTGGGVQALLAAKHARAVVGTDVNRRALALARIAAALNRIEHAEWRHGSLFDPVAGETYDLVTANPPFVISPDLAYAFRDGGGDGDSISRQVVAGAASAVNAGGWGTVLCNWVDPSGPDWAEPVRRWVAGSGCDAWVLRYRTDDPVTYAALWNTQAGQLDERSMEAALDRWVAYYERLGISAIVTGAVVLHRPCGGGDGGGRVWADDMTAGPDGPAGDQIRRVFAHRARLDAGPGSQRDDNLLDAVLVPVDGAVLEQSLTRRAGRYEPASLSVRQHPGLGIAADVPPDVVPALVALDGRRTLRDVLADSEADGATEHVLAAARRLLELGVADWRADA